MPQRLFLLDAYALIYRAYYAFIRSPRIDSKGRNTSAIFGFVLMLEDLLGKEQPEELAVVFDPPGGTFRHREYPAYKAQREETPEGIRIAIPFIRQLLEAYRIPMVEVADYEADDVIGTIAKAASRAGREVYMVTPDKDYGQLVSDTVRMYRPMQGGGYEIWGVEEINEKFGLSSPSQVIDYLALLGDKVDNIPGCKGIGEKGAQKL
ncbi:MAG: DNA polymerase I, partial [Porphyromonadaceae bacterium]|nr:DNA polymerase I [Porphyromonadaceae bacterium]